MSVSPEKPEGYPPGDSLGAARLENIFIFFRDEPVSARADCTRTLSYVRDSFHSPVAVSFLLFSPSGTSQSSEPSPG